MFYIGVHVVVRAVRMLSPYFFLRPCLFGVSASIIFGLSASVVGMLRLLRLASGFIVWVRVSGGCVRPPATMQNLLQFRGIGVHQQTSTGWRQLNVFLFRKTIELDHLEASLGRWEGRMCCSAEVSASDEYVSHGL